MSGAIDIPNQFPNSYMASAVRAGQSRFISAQTAAVGTLLMDTTALTPPPPPKEPVNASNRR